MTGRAATAAARVAVIGGGQNCEHAVSLASAAAVAGALESAGHAVVRLTIGRDGGWRQGDGCPVHLADAVQMLRTCDLAVPMLHGPRGEDGTLAALCELAGVSYVGSGVLAGALAMDKWATKLVAAGSSQGVALVRSAAEFTAALAAAFALDSRVLVEDVVTGREIDVAVLGRPDGSRTVAPALEIVADGVFDFATKYGGGADFRVPAELTDAERKELEDAAVAMFDALGCGGVARVDFFLTADGPVLNEVNTAPGFTEESQVPKMFAAAGVSYAELLDLLVRDVLAGLAA